jgi:hypothetical protein
MDTRSLKCPNCGAPLEGGAGDAIRCAFCGSLVRTEDAAQAAAAEAAESPYIRYLANGQAIEQIDGKLAQFKERRAALALETNSGSTLGCAGIVGFLVFWALADILAVQGVSSWRHDVATALLELVLAAVCLGLPVAVALSMYAAGRKRNARRTAQIKDIDRQTKEWAGRRARVQAEMDEFLASRGR